MVSPSVFKQEEKPCKESIEVSPNLLRTNRRYKTFDEVKKDLYTVLFCAISSAILVSILFTVRTHYLNKEMKRYEGMFSDFILKYDRRYLTLEEFEKRFKVFANNIREFEKEEALNLGLDYDVNEFTDWTDDELRRMTNPMNEHDESETVRFEGNHLETGVKRPASIDWRDQGKLTAIKNQGQCGSCWAFATVAAVEAQHAIKKGNLVSLSEQEMVDCDGRNNGCNGGYRPYAMKFVKDNGLESEKKYPYSALKHDQCFLKENDTRVFIDDYRMLSTNEEDIANWVGTKGPVTFGMNVVKAMYSYRSGIFNPTAEDCAEKSMGAHALTIVGYGGEGETAYWIVKNSWGTSWGASGYFRLARGVNSCGMANTVVAPIIN